MLFSSYNISSRFISLCLLCSAGTFSPVLLDTAIGFDISLAIRVHSLTIDCYGPAGCISGGGAWLQRPCGAHPGSGWPSWWPLSLPRRVCVLEICGRSAGLKKPVTYST
eukprot:scaffold267076_cov32-Prasinocladus_malaysianus.AAC.1